MNIVVCAIPYSFSPRYNDVRAGANWDPSNVIRENFGSFDWRIVITLSHISDDKKKEIK